jgi:hypothetical protein
MTTMEMNAQRYYSGLLAAKRINGPSMDEVVQDLRRQFSQVYAA